jgi:hypothetical protein
MQPTLALLRGNVVTVKTGDETFVGTVSWTEDAGLWITIDASQRPPMAPMGSSLAMFFSYTQIRWLATPVG